MSTRNEALTELLARPSWVRALARSLVSQEADAEDILQEAAVAAIRRPPSGGLPRAWISRVLFNLASKARRSSARRADREALVAAGDHDHDAATVRDAERRLAIQRDVAQAVLSLDEPQRSAVIRHYVEGMPAVRIAQVDGISPEAVRQRLARARAKLREALDGEYGGRRSAWSGALLSLADTGSDGAPSHAARRAPGSSASVSRRGVWSPSSPPAAASSAPVWLGTVATVAAVVLLAASAWRQRESGGADLDSGPGRVAALQGSRPGKRASHEGPALEPPGAEPRSLLHATEAFQPPDTAAASSPAANRAKLVLHVHRERDGEPAPGAVVILRHESAQSTPRSVVTDAHGIARVDPIEPGALEVVLQLRSDDPDRIELSRGETRRLDLIVPAGYTVRGVVRDAHGYPLADAGIWVGEPWSRVRGHILARTNEEGCYELTDVKPDGMHWIGARAPRHAPSQVRYFDASVGDVVEYDIVLDRAGGDVRGTVRDTHGKAIVGAEVLVGYQSPEWASSKGGSPPHFGLTDGAGAFFLAGVPAGTQPVLARSPHTAAWRGELWVRPSSESEIAIELTPDTRVVGRVEDARGNPVGDALVRVLSDYRFLSATAWTHQDGRFELHGLVPGAVRLEATHEKEGVAHTRLHIAGGETADWTAVLRPEPRVFGTVRDAQRLPVAGREIALWDGAEQYGVQYTFTDEAGRFSFDAEQGRPLTLVVYSDSDDFPPLVHEGAVASLEALELELPDTSATFARLIGRVLGPDGEPVDAARFGLLRLESRIDHDLPPDGVGRFELLVPPGTFQLRAGAEGHATLALGTRSLEAGESVDLGDLFLPDAAFVHGVVGGPEVGEIRIAWMRSDGESIERGTLMRGEYRSPPLAAGAYRAVFQGASSYRLELDVAVVAGADLQRDVRLDTAPVRRVTATLPDGDPRPTWLDATARDENGRLAWEWHGAPRPAGPIELSLAAAPGRYDVTIRSDSGHAGEEWVAVSSDPIAPAIVHLRRTPATAGTGR